MILPTGAAVITIPSHYPHASDRVKRQFRRHGSNPIAVVNAHLPYNEAPAVEPGDIGIGWPDEPPPDFQGYPGSWYLYRTFREVIAACRNSSDESILILEHDALVLPEFAATLAVVEPPEDWECLYLGAMHGLGDGAETEQVAPHLLRVNGSVGLHATIFHRRVFDRLLVLPMATVHDCEIATLVHPRGHSYAIWPSVVIQAAGVSSITGEQGGWPGLWESRGRIVDMRPVVG